MTESEFKRINKAILELLVNKTIDDNLTILSGLIGGMLCPGIQFGKYSVEEAKEIAEYHMKKVERMLEFANHNKEVNPGFGMNK